jgi:hypothetical protein
MDEEFKLIGYQLLENKVIRDSDGEIEDYQQTVIAEGKTVQGLVRYARLKKLDASGDISYSVESVEQEYMPNAKQWKKSEGNIYHKSLEELL